MLKIRHEKGLRWKRLTPVICLYNNRATLWWMVKKPWRSYSEFYSGSSWLLRSVVETHLETNRVKQSDQKHSQTQSSAYFPLLIVNDFRDANGQKHVAFIKITNCPLCPYSSIPRPMVTSSVHLFSHTFLAWHTFATPVERVKAAWVG